MPYGGGYYPTDPAQYQLRQQDRRDDQIRNIMNMFLQMKQMQEQRGQQQREWDFGQTQYANQLSRQKSADELAQRQFGLDEKSLTTNEGRAASTQKYQEGQLDISRGNLALDKAKVDSELMEKEEAKKYIVNNQALSGREKAFLLMGLHPGAPNSTIEDKQSHDRIKSFNSEMARLSEKLRSDRVYIQERAPASEKQLLLDRATTEYNDAVSRLKEQYPEILSPNTDPAGAKAGWDAAKGMMFPKTEQAGVPTFEEAAKRTPGLTQEQYTAAVKRFLTQGK